MKEKESGNDNCPSCGSPAFAGHMSGCNSDKRVETDSGDSGVMLEKKFQEFISRNVANIKKAGIDNDYMDTKCTQ